MTREQGIEQIERVAWAKGEGCLEMRVRDAENSVVVAWLQIRPAYCDRGHIQLNIDGPLQLDSADSFPRYFFSFIEADAHTRAFLKWRLWRERTYSDGVIRSVFEE